MNFKALKGLITSLTSSFKCNECKSTITEENIDIIGAAGNTINIDITCTTCGKHSMVKSEVLSIDPSKLNLSKEDIELLKSKTSTKKAIRTELIKDSEIVGLNDELKQDKLNVSDLFGEDE